MTQLETKHDDGQLKRAEAPKVPILTLEDGFAYFEGKVVPMTEAKVSIATHALNYGTACFEGIRAYWNADHQQIYVLKLREHYERMENSWKVLMMHPDETVDDLCRVTVELIKKHSYESDVYIRPLAYKASRTIKLALDSMEDAVAVYTFPMGNYVDISSGLRACTSSWRRANSNAMPVRAKVSGAYVNSSLAVDDARASGFDEAIMLTQDGTVSEASSCNLFLIRNGKFITPGISEDILEGITRSCMIEMIQKEFGITVEERRVDRTELYAAEEVFMCGTGVQVSPVTSIDHRPVGTGQPGELTMKLQKLYLAACRGENEQYRHWITPVY